jgi:hypothetical protein
VFGADGGAIGPAFITRSNGFAMSPDLPLRVPLNLREVAPPPGVEPPTDLPFTLMRRREALVVTNRRHQPGPYGSQP